MRKLKKFVCQQCGKTYQTRDYKKDKLRLYCSVKCRHKSQIKHFERECFCCGKIFKPKHDAKFCSLQCVGLYKKKSRMRNICKECGKTFYTPKSVEKVFCSRVCFDKYNKKNKWIEKVCPVCGKTFRTRISKESNHCSSECNLKSEKRKINLSKKYKGKTLQERGWSEEAIKKDRQIKVTRNKENIGKTIEEILGVEKGKTYRKKMSEIKKGVSTLEMTAKKHDCSLEEARKYLPGYGKVGEKHPMFGKHHSVESKIKMMETFEKNGSMKGRYATGLFDNISWRGTWELKFLIDMIEKGKTIKRYDLKPVEYIFENEKHHYFPDYVIDDKIYEIKGLEKNHATTKIKTETAKRIWGNDYIFIDNVEQNMPARLFYKVMKEKYEDRLQIKHNPYEKNIIEVEEEIEIGELVEKLGCNNPKQIIKAPSSLQVLTPNGYRKIKTLLKTQPNPEWEIETENHKMVCADFHKVETENGWKNASFLDKTKKIKTDTGWEQIKHCFFNGKYSNMYDMEVEDTHSYWTNGIHSHNTGFLGNIALNCFLDNRRVLVYTFETSSERLSMRYFQNLAEMSKQEIILDENTMKQRIDKISSLTTGDLIIKEYNSNSVCSNDLMAHINDLWMYEKWKPDVVVADYILIMSTNDRSLTSSESYKYYKTVTEELRNIAKSLYIPIVSACQINRQGMSDRGGSKALVTAKDVAESRGIYDTCDVFLTLAQTANDKKKNNIYLYIDKNRNDRSGIRILFKIDYEHHKLTEGGIVA